MRNVESESFAGLMEKLVGVYRHSKVVKGGRRFSFTALVVVGDGQGKVGYGLGTAAEVSIAIQKAMEAARKNTVDIELNDDTVWYEMSYKHGATKIFMKPASKGTGIIAGGAMRAVFEVMGVNNILSKTYGSTNPINVVKGTVKALISMQTPGVVSAKRKKQVVLS
jgi:small subunit ribosomal protein S5